MNIKEINGSVTVTELEYFSVAQTFDCGQSFRFRLTAQGEAECAELSKAYGISDFDKTLHRADGVAFGRRISFIQPSKNSLIITPCTLADFEEIWKHYLALDADYAAIRRDMEQLRPFDTTLKKAMDKGSGIRILRQEPWEALCTFIISQNNNIPRITGLVRSLCRAAGKEIPAENAVNTQNYTENPSSDNALYSFPAPSEVAALGVDGLFALKTGFRAAYLFDAASRVSSGEIDISSIRALSTADAAQALMKIKGVGPKVAACSLLFGFEKDDAFPIDVWVKRVLAQYYPDGIAPQEFGSHAGLAQQYLFYLQRYSDTEA